MSADDALPASFVKLLVGDAARAAAFYEELGFERIHVDAVFTHLRWRGADVFLVAAPAGAALPDRRTVGVLLGFRADDVGVDALAARARAVGAMVDGPRDQPWRTREILVDDPDGYRLNFVQRM